MNCPAYREVMILLSRKCFLIFYILLSWDVGFSLPSSQSCPWRPRICRREMNTAVGQPEAQDQREADRLAFATLASKELELESLKSVLSDRAPEMLS